MRQVLRILAMALLLWNLAAPSVLAAEDVRIAVRGPEYWDETDTYRLEVGDRMWVVVTSRGGFVTSVPSNAPVASFRRVRDCHEMLRIDLVDGGRYVIRAAGDGTFALEDRTGTGLDLGPSYESQPFTPCLPDTSTATTASTGGDALLLPFLSVAALSGLATLSWLHRRRASATAASGHDFRD